MNTLKLLSTSAEDTETIGFRLGNILKKSQRPVIILLYGSLGSGKTTLVKGIASAVGINSRDVGSASFVIVAEYESEPPFCHIDLYRLSGMSEAEDMGLWDYLYREAITVVEWADRLDYFPDAAIKINIEDLKDNSRTIQIEGLNEEDRYYIEDN